MAIEEKCVRNFSKLLCLPCCKQLRNNLHKQIAFNENGLFQQYILSIKPNRTESSQQSKHGIPFDFNMHENENLLMRKFTNHTKLCSGIFDTNSRTKQKISNNAYNNHLLCLAQRDWRFESSSVGTLHAKQERKKTLCMASVCTLSDIKEWLEFVPTKKLLLLHYC